MICAKGKIEKAFRKTVDLSSDLVTKDIENFNIYNKELSEKIAKHFKIPYSEDLIFKTIPQYKDKVLVGYKAVYTMFGESVAKKIDMADIGLNKDSSSIVNRFNDTPENLGLNSFDGFIEQKSRLKNRLLNRYNRVVSERKFKEKNFSSVVGEDNKRNLKSEITYLHGLEQKLKEHLYGSPIKGIEGISNEIDILKRKEDLNILAYYAERDLVLVDDLIQMGDIESLNEARSIVSFYENIGTFKKDVANLLFLDSDKDNSHLDISENLKEFLTKIKGYATAHSNEIVSLEKKRVVDFLNAESGVNTNEEIVKSYNDYFFARRDVTSPEKYMFDSTKNILGEDTAVTHLMIHSHLQGRIDEARNFKNDISDRIDNILPDVEKALKRLSGSNTTYPDYTIFRRKTANGFLLKNSVSRFTHEFDMKNNTSRNMFFKSLRSSNSIRGKEKRALAKKMAFKERKDWINDNTHIIDFKSLPEFGGVDTDLRESLKSLLGDLGYDNIIKEQKELLENYKNQLDIQVNIKLAEDGVSSYDELSDVSKEYISWWVNTNDPASFLEEIQSEKLLKGEVPTGQFNILVPKDRENYDSDFSTIEQDPALKEFHEIMGEVSSRVYHSLDEESRKGFSENTIHSLSKGVYEIMKTHEGNLLYRVFEVFRDLIDRLKKTITEGSQSDMAKAVRDPVTGEYNYTIKKTWLKNHQNSINKKVSIYHDKIAASIKEYNIPSNRVFDLNELYSSNPEVISILAEALQVEPNLSSIRAALPNEDMSSVKIMQFIKQGVTHQHMQNDTLDLPKVLKNYAYFSAAYEARQQALPILNIVKRHHDEIDKLEENTDGSIMRLFKGGEAQIGGKRTNAIQGLESHFRRAVLDDDSSKSGLGDTKIQHSFFGRTKLGKILRKKNPALEKALQEIKSEIDEVRKKKEETEKRLDDIKDSYKNIVAKYDPTKTQDFNSEEDILKALEGVIAAGKKLKLTPDEKYYVDEDGNKYLRTTSFISDKDLVNNDYLESAQHIGTAIDDFIRDFFDPDKGLEYMDISDILQTPGYDFMQGSAQQQHKMMRDFINTLKNFKEDLASKGQTVISKEITLFNKELGVAGTVDLLSYDKDGNVFIYDIKTMRNNKFNKLKIGTSTPEYDYKEPGGQSMREKHNAQLSLYATMLNNTFGIKAEGLEIVPFEIFYEPGDKATSRLKLLERVEMTHKNIVQKRKGIEYTSVEEKLNELEAEEIRLKSELNELESQSLSPARKGKLLTREEKEYKKELDSLIVDYKANLEIEVNKKGTPDYDENKVKFLVNKVKSLEETVEDVGGSLAAVKVFDAFFHYLRFKSLGWSLKSSTTNLMEGQSANLIQAASGIYFTPENIYRANKMMKYSFAKNIMSVGGSKIEMKGGVANKNAILMRRFDVLMDQSNELQKSSKNTSFSKYSWLNPYELTVRVEYLNQMPLMVAMLLDEKIKSIDGTKEVNVYDAMDNDGNLLPEFRSEENILNWEKNAGNKVKGFNERLKDCIKVTHGDYSDLGGNVATETIPGKALLMFKRWMPMSFFNKFAKEREVSVGGKKIKFKGRYRSHTKASAMLHGGLLGFGGLTLIGVGGIPGIAVGLAGGYIASRFIKTDTSVDLFSEMATLGKGLLKTMAGIPVNSIMGKEVIKKESLNHLKNNNFAQIDINNMRSLFVEISLLAAFQALTLITKSLFWDDDDEEGSTRRNTHNALVNQLMSMSSQSAMFLDTSDLYGSFIGNLPAMKFFDDVKTMGSKVKKLTEGEDILIGGPNRGRSGVAMQARKLLLPGMFRDMPSLRLGFEGSMQKQYKPHMSDTWFHGEEKKAKNKVKRWRAEYKYDLLSSGVSGDEITKKIKEKYPYKKSGTSHVDHLKYIESLSKGD